MLSLLLLHIFFFLFSIGKYKAKFILISFSIIKHYDVVTLNKRKKHECNLRDSLQLQRVRFQN